MSRSSKNLLIILPAAATSNKKRVVEAVWSSQELGRVVAGKVVRGSSWWIMMARGGDGSQW